MDRSDGFFIRTATASDAERVDEIWRRGSSDSLGFESDIPGFLPYFRDCILDTSAIFKFWVAVDSTTNRVIGWQSLRPCETNPIMRTMIAVASTYVDPDSRIRGVGRALLVHAAKYADESALHFITACVLAQNTAILKIVLNTGWIEAGAIPRSLKNPSIPETMMLVYVAQNPASPPSINA